jgi:hypothetical protein
VNARDTGIVSLGWFQKAHRGLTADGVVEPFTVVKFFDPFKERRRPSLRPAWRTGRTVGLILKNMIKSVCSKHPLICNNPIILWGGRNFCVCDNHEN